MAINPDIRDQAYQFFVEEAPELLHTLETKLLTLKQDHSTANVHSLMRAAHTLKGGAASVGLEPIATIAHRLETILKAFYGNQLTIDTDLENQLLQAYDCLRLPLLEQINTGTFDAEYALAIAEPIFAQIEARCGDALNQAEGYIPSSAELGVDMVVSIFEVDVVQGIEYLASVAANPQINEVAGALRAQLEVFAGFAELLNLPEFATIVTTVQQALTAHPECALEITQLAIVEFKRYRQAVLSGKRTETVHLSADLLSLAGVTESASWTGELNVEQPDMHSEEDITNTEYLNEVDRLQEADFSSLENIFGKEIVVPLADIENEYLTVDRANYLNTVDESVHSRGFAIEPESELVDADSMINATIEAFATEAIDTDYTTTDYATTDYATTDYATTDYATNISVPATGGLVPTRGQSIQLRDSPDLSYPANPSNAVPTHHDSTVGNPNLTVRVDVDRLERLNSVVGELAISHNGLFLQSDQLLGKIRELLNRFSRFQTLTGQLQQLSDQILVAPERYRSEVGLSAKPGNGISESYSDLVPLYSSTYPTTISDTVSSTVEFDSLEMDTYGAMHSQLQGILEEVVQLEEAVDDIAFFARQSNQMLYKQRPMLAQLQDEVTWARMVPIGEVLSRFPRMVRDLSATHRKLVNLKLIGTGVLVDKAMLEKLYDPLLHLVRNAFDHGIESPDIRRQYGKSAQGEIEIRTYHRGNQTIIEVKDDGQGLNLNRIRDRIFELGWMSANQLIMAPPAQLFEYIFAPGFSTAQQVSKLSGRGVGLDVVRSQLQAVKGTVSVESSPGKGTTFTLRLPLMLTIAKLIICRISSVTLALSIDSVAEILTPKLDQIRHSGNQRFLYWHDQIIPIYRLMERLEYRCPLPETVAMQTLASIATPKECAAPMLVFRKDQQIFALEVEQVLTEQELVIKPLDSTIAPPSYTYGCTILADGSLVPVIDAIALLTPELNSAIEPTASHDATSTNVYTAYAALPAPTAPPPVKTIQSSTILVIDDAATLRRTLALSLERSGFRVVQARDGQEAIEQLQQRPSIQLVICDIEMPNMNGFEFLNHRRQDPQLAKIPVVILTSRSNEKHRWLAMQLGATAYFTKPYLEQEFLDAIGDLV